MTDFVDSFRDNEVIGIFSVSICTTNRYQGKV